jgi:hypothetical protein
MSNSACGPRLDIGKYSPLKHLAQGAPYIPPMNGRVLRRRDKRRPLKRRTVNYFFHIVSDARRPEKRGGVYTQARHDRLLKMFRSIENKDLTEEEKIQFKKIALKMAVFIHTDPLLTKDQTQICAAIMVLTSQKYKNAFKECPPELSTAAQTMVQSYTQMNKEGGVAEDVDRMIFPANQTLPAKTGRNPSPLHEALEQWKNPRQREQAIQTFLAIPNLSMTAIYLFFKKTEGTPEESFAKNHLEEYFQTHATTVCPPGRKESYDRVYSDLLLIAEQRGLTWYEAMIFASSCAKKYFEIDSYITQAGQASGKSLAIEQNRSELMKGFLREYSLAFLKELIVAVQAQIDYNPEAMSEKLSRAAQSHLLEKINTLAE